MHVFPLETEASDRLAIKDEVKAEVADYREERGEGGLTIA
jgi:hypothetical protein